MSSLGSLVVSLSANTAQFASDMGKAAHIAAQNFEKIRKDAIAVGQAIGTMFAAGATSSVYLVKQSLDSADALLKMSQSSGIAIDKLSGFTYAARLAGVEVDAFGTAAVRLTKGISDAAMGTGEAQRAYEALGMSVKDAVTGKLKSADSVLLEVAEKFSTMEDGLEKTALAVALFGRAGAQMIPMLNMGASGLAEMHAEAEKLGIVLDKETAAAAERFNDNLTRLNAVKQGFSNQIMQAMLPALENLSEVLFTTASNTEGLSKAAVIAAGSMKTLMSAGLIIAGVFKTLGEMIGGVGASLVALFSGRFKEAFNIYEESALDFASNVRGTVNAVTAVWDEAANQSLAKAPETGKKLAAPAMRAAEETKKAKKEIDKAAKEAALAQKRLMEEGRRVFEETRTPMEKLAAELSRQQMLLDADAISWDTYTRAIFAAQDAYDELTAKSKESTDQMTEFAVQAARNMQDAFADFFFDAMQGKFSDLVGSFKQTIDRMVANLLASQLMNFLTGDFGKTGVMGGFLGEMFSGMFPGRAIGGPVSSGTAYRVGEHGTPEIFIPSTSGTIVPESKMSSRTVVVNNHFTISQPTDRRTQEQIASLAGASIQRAMSRGS